MFSRLNGFLFRLSSGRSRNHPAGISPVRPFSHTCNRSIVMSADRAADRPYDRSAVQRNTIRPPIHAGARTDGSRWRRRGSPWRYALWYKRSEGQLSLPRPGNPVRNGRMPGCVTRPCGRSPAGRGLRCPTNMKCSGHSSKLCFLLHGTLSAAENSLPARGGKLLRSRRFFRGHGTRRHRNFYSPEES